MSARPMDDHDVTILASARAAEMLVAELCDRNTGWEPFDVVSGLLWGVAKMCRKFGLTREQVVKYVTTALDCVELDERAAKEKAS